MKKSQLGDFFGFVMFFFIVIVMIVILSFFGVFNFNLTQKNSIEKDTSYSTTINSFLTQPLFPAKKVLRKRTDVNLTFLELLSYGFSRNKDVFSDENFLENFIPLMPLHNFKISFDGKDQSFIFEDNKWVYFDDYDCVPVYGNDFFYFPFDVYYYDEKGNLVSKRVVFSSVFDSDFGFLPLCVLKKKG